MTFIPLGNNAIKDILLDINTKIFPYPFTIQNVMWVIFFVGLGELINRYRFIKFYSDEIDRHYLPEDDQTMLDSKDRGIIFQKVRKEKPDGLAELIKLLVMQFQSSHSIAQTHTMLNSHLELRTMAMDIKYSMIRYIVRFIPTMGFIGTVVGIAAALAFAGQADPESAEFLPGLTQQLGVAFYTTLVALFMSAVLVFIMHIVQGKEEGIIIDHGKYCLENLINRLYIEK